MDSFDHAKRLKKPPFEDHQVEDKGELQGNSCEGEAIDNFLVSITRNYEASKQTMGELFPHASKYVSATYVIVL